MNAVYDDSGRQLDQNTSRRIKRSKSTSTRQVEPYRQCQSIIQAE